jgi:hypothetical protein
MLLAESAVGFSFSRAADAVRLDDRPSLARERLEGVHAPARAEACAVQYRPAQVVPAKAPHFLAQETIEAVVDRVHVPAELEPGAGGAPENVAQARTIPVAGEDSHGAASGFHHGAWKSNPPWNPDRTWDDIRF